MAAWERGRSPVRRRWADSKIGLVALQMLLMTLPCFGLPAPASPRVEFRRLVVPDHVPAQVITALVQDRNGFLWIGTQSGLFRYDGYEFRPLPLPAGDGKTLSEQYIRALLVSRSGKLFIGTFSNGLAIFDPAIESFSAQPDLGSERVEALAEDPQGRIWVGTSTGLFRLDQDGGVVPFRRREGDPSSLLDERIRSLLVDHEGRLWVGGPSGLLRQSDDGQGFERIALDLDASGWLSQAFVSRLLEDRQRRLWIASTDRGVAMLDRRSPNPTLRVFRPGNVDGLSHFWGNALAEVGDELWIGTFGGGIDVIDTRSLEISARLRHDPSSNATINGDRVGALLVDSAGVVWVGSWGQGLARHDPWTRAWTVLRMKADELSHPAAVRTVEAADGRIWVGTNGNGIDVFDRDWQRVDAFRPDPSDPTALADGAITCFARGPSDQIWVATLDGTLHRHESEGHFSRLGQREGLAGGQIRALSFAFDGALWAGSSQGLTRVGFDERGRVADIKTFRHNVDDDNSLSGVAVEALAWAADGRLWVGTDQGLNLLDPTTARIRRFLRRAHDPAGLPNNWIPDLLMARDGRLWIATAGGVALLESLEEDGARFSTLATLTGTDPLPADSLIEDGEGAIWIGPHRRVDPRNWQISEFGPADGKTLRSFFIASRTRLSDGRLLFGSHEGLLAVDPATLRPWNFEPNLVATGLRIGSRKHPAGLNRLQLQPGDKSFSLDFAALDFSAPERNRYRHRLHGFENLWQETSASQRTLTYTNLEPGTYRLEVSGSNRAGLFSSHRLEIALEVLPAFTQTLLFKLLLAVLVSLLCYLGYRLTLRQLKHRSEVLERLVRERTLALEESNRQLEAAHRRTEEASLSDSLTGIRNRRFLENSIRVDTDLVERRWRESAPGLESDLIFLLLDLDHFKSVNDSWGHRAGDAVLIQSADLLKRQLRSSDFLVRWGGEEFLIVARFVDRATAPKLAEKLRRAIAEHAFTLPDGGVIERTVSIGFAAYPFLQDQPSTYDWEKTVHLADLALYRAKNDGRNRALGLAAGPNLLPGSDLTNLASALAAGAVALV